MHRVKYSLNARRCRDLYFQILVRNSLGEASVEVYEETRQNSPLAAKITDAFMLTLRDVAGWQKISEIAYSN